MDESSPIRPSALQFACCLFSGRIGFPIEHKLQHANLQAEFGDCQCLAGLFDSSDELEAKPNRFNGLV
jgi:hypothetical protein